MKSLLIATAALTLMGGAAFAQDQTMAPAGGTGAAAPAQGDAAAPNAMGSGSSTGAAQDPSMSGSQMNTGTPPASDPNSATTSGGAMSSGSTGTDTGAGAGAMASNASAGAAQESYPVCTSKHEDHCTNRAQATRTARASTRHQKTDNVQPSGM